MPVISTNTAANAALNYLNINSSNETESIAQLASGSRIVQAKDDAAGLAIGTQLDANVTVFQEDEVNVAQGTSILQSTDGALAQVSNVLARMLSLATESASGQVTDTQYQQLRGEISSIVSSTTYAGNSLLTGSFLSNVKFLIGTQSSNFISVSLKTVNTTTLLGASGSTVSTAASALKAIGGVNSAINTITKDRALVGAYESQFNFSGQDIATNVQNISSAASVIMDADVAQVKSSLSAQDVKTQAAIAALTQASQLPQELLHLLQS